MRLPDGSLVQGMAGSIPQTGAVPAGYVGNPMSADGVHLVFGSTSQFETAGNNNGDVTIYDRDLSTRTTQVVSTDAGRHDDDRERGSGSSTSPPTGRGSSSARKSRPTRRATAYWHPYMHIGSSANSVDLAPGTTTGVLYDGMSADGTRVFYSTTRQTGRRPTRTTAPTSTTPKSAAPGR